MRRTGRPLTILGIESSCDETAAAVVRVGGRGQDFSFDVRSSVIASQVATHARYGGVVPEVAAREHVPAIIPVISAALTEAGLPRTGRGVHAIAVTAGPGLMTSLAVGIESARTIAYAWGVPIVGVSHIEGHVLSNVLPLSRPPFSQQEEGEEVAFPALALVVSGGHTELLRVRAWGQYELIGATRDDAVGEAFDKVAKLLGLPYPGGPAVAAAAGAGSATAYDFPRPMIDSDDFDFSYSGLKTSVRYAIAGTQVNVADVCASFQRAAVDVLVAKTVRAARHVGARTVLLGGGVAANEELRRQLSDAVARELGVPLLLPDAAYTGDNAAMIAAAGGVRFRTGKETGWRALSVDANWELGREAMFDS